MDHMITVTLKDKAREHQVHMQTHDATHAPYTAESAVAHAHEQIRAWVELGTWPETEGDLELVSVEGVYEPETAE